MGRTRKKKGSEVKRGDGQQHERERKLKRGDFGKMEMVICIDVLSKERS